ncbi:primary-amine oxidase [Subtercola lobariae]|uniref:Amine oxidase n=1 Tax=Subtercola lobariae TaxID=1588641 RepID=A0A917F0W8_9MICO|nr:primary-amine oxidase [Subtercola lobariae]GGF33835.1 amine oxidase [Subtercola lobariae]
MSITQHERSIAGMGDVQPHPLDNLSVSELDAVRKILHDGEFLLESTRFVHVGLEEPNKKDVLAFSPGDAVRRWARAILIDLATGESQDIVVDIVAASVVSVRSIAPEDGQVAILDEEFELIGPIIQADPGFQEAIARRGIDPAQVVSIPLSAGHYGFDDELNHRVARSLFFMQDHPTDACWAHPVDGLCAYVDMTEGRVIKLVDFLDLPVPKESGNYDDPAFRGPERKSLKPLEISQPDGPSYQVDGEVVTWQNWKFRVGFDAREGLILRQLSFHDKGEDRPIIYRASIAEMVVPYADPSPVRFWQNYFDTGEYMFARYTNSLELGCDCVGEITYFDGVIMDEQGHPKTIKNAICMHEEDYGILWKHSDFVTGSNETRRQRRLVISFFTTVGNYDYGFFWYLYLDGTIECEAKLTGILFTSSYRGKDYPYANEVAPGLGAPYHQHLFSARLDMTVDGTNNTVQEVEVKRVPAGPGNEHGNAFTNKATPITNESEGGRLANASLARTWHITNPNSLNRFGDPVSYVLYPEQNPVLLADESATVTTRAQFTTKQLWITQYDPKERYSAGDFPNQHLGGGGIPEYQKAGRSLENEDIVLWHTFGPTHFPRPEDWPVMPVDYAKFTLKPHGFFDRNPTLDVPADVSHQHHADGGTDGHTCH